MAEIANFPSRKKSKGFLSSMTASAQAAAPVEPEPEPESAPEPTDAVTAPAKAKSAASKAPAHNTTVNLTLDQRAWLRWREVVTKQSMGDLVRDAIDEQMASTPMPPEVASIFRS